MSEDRSNPSGNLTTAERTQLLRLAYRFCWDHGEAEDAVQNALLKAAHSPPLRNSSKRWSWLCRVVIQHCHLAGRNKDKRDRALANADERSSPAAHDRLTQQELAVLMRRLLVQLPNQQRTAVTLRHIEQLSYTQIAQILDVTEPTARAHVRAGREALRQMILARHPEWQL